MTDSYKPNEIADAITGVAKAVPVYQDLAQPAVRQLGLALETVAKTVRVALAPVSGLVWGYDKIAHYLDERLTEKLRFVPPERIATPPAHVAGPALEAMRFTGETHELREMYANLLATAMDSATVEKAHPAFVDIIKQLTPDEARILRVLSNKRYRPLIHIMAKRLDDRGEIVFARHQTLVDNEAGVSRPALMPSYLDNLIRLGLIEVPDGKYLTAAGAYDAIESDPNVTSTCKAVSDTQTHTPRIERSFIALTDLGLQFVSTCVLEGEGKTATTGA